MNAGMNVLFVRLARFGTVLALAVVMLGAWVRLHDAGLGCPDWPGCYGKLVVPDSATAAQDPGFAARPLVAAKAWREMIHRYLAGTLVLVCVALGVLAWRNRQDPSQPWRRPLALLGLIVFQALLGMWTVTWKLLPAVVMGHLLGGLLLFALLAYTALRLTLPAAAADLSRLHRLTVIGIVLLAVQIALGGWTSSNYAALACGNDFPKCLGFWWPPTDFREGFVLWRGIGVNYEGGVLDTAARTAIQLAHRIGALIVLGHVGLLAVVTARRAELRGYGIAIGALLLLQIALGISNVMLGLPLPVAIAHNGVAAVLLFALLALLVRTRDVRRETREVRAEAGSRS